MAPPQRWRLCRPERRETRTPMQHQNVAGRSLMRAEIEQQPGALRDTIEALLPRRDEVAALAADTRTVLFIARGTSDNAAVYGSYLIQAHAGRLTSLAAPSIATTYRARIDLSGVLAVALSQSGRTEEIVETLAWAKDCGARTMAITNGGASSPLAQAADVAFVTRGRDRAGRPSDQDVHHPAGRARRARPRSRCAARRRRAARGAGRDRRAARAAEPTWSRSSQRWRRCQVSWCPAGGWPTRPRWSWPSS